MIAEQPRHGYELIKAIYVCIDAEEAGRKRYRITPAGEAFLAANRASADALLARAAPAGGEGGHSVPAPMIRAMENLKLALRLRLRGGPIDQATAESIAATLDEAARAIERS